jgi:hypothetical protein
MTLPGEDAPWLHDCGPDCDVCVATYVPFTCPWCGGDEAQRKFDATWWEELVDQCVYCDEMQPVDGWGR